MRILVMILTLFATQAMAEPTTVTITEKECKKLIRMNSFSGADYVAGVDAHGRKVKGADLHGGSPIKIPKEITFNLGIDLAEKYDMPAGTSASFNLGEIRVKGRDVYWNGQRLGGGENRAILQACKHQYGLK